MKYIIKITLQFSMLLCLTSCVAFKVGNIHGTYNDHVFPTKTPLGLEVMELEEKHDPTILTFNKNNPPPDFIYIGGTYEIDFIYIKPEKMFHFQRGFSNISTVEKIKTIPHKIKRKISYLYPQYYNGLVPQGGPSNEWRGYGTGFAVSPNLIITAAHVIKKAKEIEVKFEGKEWKKVKLKQQSFKTDIASLVFSTKLVNWVDIVEKPKMNIGGEVFTIGYPTMDLLGNAPKYTSGDISSLSGIANDDISMQITVPIQPGNSGGPLLNKEGQLIGVITSTAAVKAFLNNTGTIPQNINWAVKLHYVLPFLNESILKQKKKILKTKEAIIDNTQSSICQIRVK